MNSNQFDLKREHNPTLTVSYEHFKKLI